MGEKTNRRVLLRARPEGAVKESDFEIAAEPVREPGAGEVLVKGLYLSLDPYMRGRMSAAKSYAPPVDLGDVMIGEVVGEVVASKDPAFAHGDHVAGMLGWQEWATVPAGSLRKIRPNVRPVSYALGVLGMPGLTAFFGLLEVGRPRPGDTVVVSAASGAVGSVVGQLARAAGCRVVGIVGSDSKADYIRGELGFDAAINHRTATDMRKAVALACPRGVDVYFDNVGADVTDAVVANFAFKARMVVCGMIAQYNLTEAYRGPDHLRSILVNRARIEGFLVFDWAHRYAEGIARLRAMLESGALVYREDIVDGIERAPAGLIGLFEGENFGKRLVRLAQD